MGTRQYRSLRHALIPVISALTLGCSQDDPIPEGRVGHVTFHFGGVAADEPRAAIVGRDVLSAGGTAADAVAAMGFAMMVTRPDAAGPGGGGMCVAYSADENKAEALEFLPHPSRSRPQAGRWVATAPGSFRGLFALHARFGKLRWEQIVFPAERMARFGVDTSRALSSVLKQSGGRLILGQKEKTIFTNKAGGPLEVRDRMTQIDLARILARIRGVGPGDFYSGRLAHEYVRAVAGLGGWLTVDDLRNYRPVWTAPGSSTYGDHDLHFAPSPSAGGQVALSIWNALGNKSSFLSADEGQKAVQVANAARQAFAGSSPDAAAGSGTAGALALDRGGNAVSCVFTMNRTFGVSRLAGDTGIIPAPPAGIGTTLGIVPIVSANRHRKQAVMAMTGAGDSFAPVSAVSVLLRVQDNFRPDLAGAVAAKRIGPSSGQVLVEEGAAQGVLNALSAAGHTVARSNRSISAVNVMFCTAGVRTTPQSCLVSADLRGLGYAINAETSR